MRVDGVADPSWLQTTWLDWAPDVVVVCAVGSAAEERAEQLWCQLEEAFELAVGCLVIVDLTEVTGFDRHTVRELLGVAQVAARRRDTFRAVARQSGGLAQCLRWCVPGEGLATYGSVAQAVAGFDAVGEDEYPFAGHEVDLAAVALGAVSAAAVSGAAVVGAGEQLLAS
jgi:hypothetical protein